MGTGGFRWLPKNTLISAVVGVVRHLFNVDSGGQVFDSISQELNFLKLSLIDLGNFLF